MNPHPGQDESPKAGAHHDQDVTRVIADVESQLLRLKEADAQRRSIAAELEQREADLAARELQLAEAANALKAEEAQVSELQARRQQLESELIDLKQRVEQRNADLAVREQELAEATKALKAGEARATELQSRRDELESELTNLKRQVEQRDAQLASLRQQVEAHRAEADAAAEQAGHERDRAQRNLSEARQQAQRAADERDAAVRDLAEARSRADRLNAELNEARSSQGSDVREIATRFELAAQERDRLKTELEQLRSSFDELTDQREKLEKELAQQARRPARVSGRAAMPERIESRTRRLHAFRGALSVRARKLRRAGEVLQQRVEQCDLLLTQRRELAAAKRALDELHKRNETARARSTGIVQLAAWLVTLSVLAGLSWVIAGRFAPPVYASKAVLASEVVGSTEGDLEAWSSFHIELLTHPRLIERVAARFQRRGMAEDATIEAVREVLDTSLVYREPEPGKLELEVVAAGKARSERWMETYVTSLVAEANESRPRRRDGLSTVVELNSTASDAPVSDPRPRYAGLGLAASASVAALLWFGLWKTMARVRAKYAASNRLDEILNEARWVDPVPDVARRPSRP